MSRIKPRTLKPPLLSRLRAQRFQWQMHLDGSENDEWELHALFLARDYGRDLVIVLLCRLEQMRRTEMTYSKDHNQSLDKAAPER